MNISGGLNVSQIYSVEAESKAFRMYSYIKNNLKMDVYNIAINTGYSVEQIRILKDYLFINSHQLISGYEPFHPNYEIGQSWLRLCGHTKNMNIQPHDLLLIKHELYEISLLLNDKRLTQIQAHKQAEIIFNYSLASREFYKSLGKV